MPDITKCDNVYCIYHTTCYRFTAIDSGRQSYCHFEPICVDVDGETKLICEYYMEVKNASED